MTYREIKQRGWTLAGYITASTTASGVAGLALGLLGNAMSSDLRIACATLLSLLGVFVGGATILGYKVALPQCDRETPRRWVAEGRFRWAIRNGAALGVGATSRIGFYLWYAVPAGATLLADPVFGALLYGSYGFTRGVGAWGIWTAARRGSFERIGYQLLKLSATATTLTAMYLTMTSVAVLLTVGL